MIASMLAAGVRERVETAKSQLRELGNETIAGLLDQLVFDGTRIQYVGGPFTMQVPPDDFRDLRDMYDRIMVDYLRSVSPAFGAMIERHLKFDETQNRISYTGGPFRLRIC